MDWAPETTDPPPPFVMLRDSAIEETRYRTWESKERETIAWIDGFTPGDLFFDVGANVGVYTLYAASRGVRVVAFEPDAKNYRRLCENIEANAFDHLVTAAQVAVSDHDVETVFSEAGPLVGGSGGQAGQTLCNGQAAYPVQAHRLDRLAGIYRVPDHVKIDIDGQEWKVVRGMGFLLGCRALNSVLIELPPAGSDRDRICSPFYGSGFDLTSPLNHIPGHSRERRKAQGIAVENLIWTRGA